MTETNLSLTTLADALSFALFFHDQFPDDDFAAVWLGTADGRPIELIVGVPDAGLAPGDVADPERFETFVDIAVDLPRVGQVVLWRRVRDDHDILAVTGAFLERRRMLERRGIELVDEILCLGDDFRSLAVTSFSDRWGWDDVTEALLAEDPDAA